MATKAERQAKLDEYDAAEADAMAKHEQYLLDATAEAEAVAKTTASRTAWLDALRHEHTVEDELEALIVEHEPPALPE